VILGINILLWFLATYPHSAAMENEFGARRAAIRVAETGIRTGDKAAIPEGRLAALNNDEAGARLRQSFAGRLGRLIEPAIRPLGFDWKMGIGIITSFAAREVFVSTMSTVYNVGRTEAKASSLSGIVNTLQEQKRPDGTPVYTALTGITLMVFYVFALQCASTVAVVRRETNSWKWPFFQWVYLAILAWGLAFITYHAGRFLG
jgi:ferrous iron transport protein B